MLHDDSPQIASSLRVLRAGECSDHRDHSAGMYDEMESPGLSAAIGGVVADFGRSSLPRRTSRPAATCLHVNQGSGPISCRVLHTGFAFRRKSFPAEKTYFDNHPRLHPAIGDTAQSAEFIVDRSAADADFELALFWTTGDHSEENKMDYHIPRRHF